MSKFEIEFKWALYFTGFNLLWLSFEKLLGWHDAHIQQHAFYSLLIVFPMIAFFVFSLKEKREKYFKDKATWQQLFLSAGVLSLIIAGISPATIFYMNKFLSPQFVDLAIESYVASNGKLEIATNFNSIEAYIKNAILFNVSTGIVIGAGVAHFLKTVPKSK